MPYARRTPHLCVCKAHHQGHDRPRQALVVQVRDGLGCLVHRGHAHQGPCTRAAVGARRAAVQHAALDDVAVWAEQRAQLVLSQVLGQVLWRWRQLGDWVAVMGTDRQKVRYGKGFGCES